MNIDFKGENKVHRDISLSIYLSIIYLSLSYSYHCLEMEVLLEFKFQEILII